MSVHKVPYTEDNWAKIANFIVRRSYVKRLNGTKDECATYGAKEQGQCLKKEIARVVGKYCAKKAQKNDPKCSYKLLKAIQAQATQYQTILAKHTKRTNPSDAEIRIFPPRKVRSGLRGKAVGDLLGIDHYIMFEAPNPEISITASPPSIPRRQPVVVKPDAGPATQKGPDAGPSPDTTRAKPDKGKTYIKPRIPKRRKRDSGKQNSKKGVIF